MADDRERDTERTTIIKRDGNGRGGAWMILLVALIVLILAVLFFAGAFNRGGDRDVNVDINTPDVNVIMPETQVPVVPIPQTEPPPDVNVNVTTPSAEPPPETNLGNTENVLANTG